MANPADITTIQTDVTNIGNASWNWHALTSDAKVVNRTCYGLILQWLPKSIIPSWFKRSISNADINKAHDKVEEKIITLLTHSQKLQPTDAKTSAKLLETCEKATRNMNELIDKINRSRAQNARLDRLDMAALVVAAQAKAAAKPTNGQDSKLPPTGDAAGLVGSPTGRNKRASKVSTPDQPQVDSTPDQTRSSRTQRNKTPQQVGANTPDVDPSTPSQLVTPKGNKGRRKSASPWVQSTAYNFRRKSGTGGDLAPLYKNEGKGKKADK